MRDGESAYVSWRRDKQQARKLHGALPKGHTWTAHVTHA
eukprot:COSAG04_NODE_26305_length_296_cov_1.055838_1_plen_38_part_10